MTIVNTSKPTTSIANGNRVVSYETWDSVTSTWDSETRTWDEMGSTMDNLAKASTSITNISRP